MEKTPRGHPERSRKRRPSMVNGQSCFVVILGRVEGEDCQWSMVNGQPFFVVILSGVEGDNHFAASPSSFGGMSGG
ncbi:hypothetical protein DN068_04810 [Taibaiella soli]|uniref:Uncharacterized protein n=1 Tax=Taibaiella soli TaxID=1649169 RepID=A0A2W2AFF1_9BACT|nr:hypothetical protein DN068_04810 [Taibaiella soli]